MERDRKRKALPDRVFSTPLLRGKRDDFKRETSWPRKAEGVCQRGERRKWGLLKKINKNCHGSLRWRTAARQAGEVQRILRQKAPWAYKIYTTLSKRQRHSVTEQRRALKTDKTQTHTLLKIQHTHTLMTTHEEFRGVALFFGWACPCDHVCLCMQVFVSIKAHECFFLRLQLIGWKPQ